ncbi:hypothetical protein CPC08DRAFT_770797 [Agrocybe pediades]|nr:hypothetical protein CPC08DRAFT_770797 [Agrocybe pediades]
MPPHAQRLQPSQSQPTQSQRRSPANNPSGQQIPPPIERYSSASRTNPASAGNQTPAPQIPTFGSADIGNETLQNALYEIQEQYQEQHEILTKVTIQNTKLKAAEGARQLQRQVDPGDAQVLAHTSAVIEFRTKIQKLGQWYQLFQSLEPLKNEAFTIAKPPFSWDSPD